MGRKIESRRGMYGFEKMLLLVSKWGFDLRTQSYDLEIYNYNASVVVGRQERFFHSRREYF
jgi:hypothetical protein